MSNDISKPKIVIIGGGFGGVYAAKALRNKAVDVILIDRKNHHTFQPLLYQVSVALLSPDEVATPLRRILSSADNIKIVLGETKTFDLAERHVVLGDDSRIEYDYLIVAAGARHSYFGKDEWEKNAPGLKTLEDAIEIRRRILLVFEVAERRANLTGIVEPLTFCVVGGGPTGVELAGAIAGIARSILAKDFKAIDTTKTRVILFEGSPKVCAAFPADLSEKARKQLEELGVEVYVSSLVTDVEATRIKVKDEWIQSNLTLWATGVAASPLGKDLSANIDRAGRVPVNADLSLEDHREVFVIGDLSSLTDANGRQVPGLASAAMQQGKAAAVNILSDLAGKDRTAFKYLDKGSMATIGRNRAIAQIGNWHSSGYFASVLWGIVHVSLLTGFRNRLNVMRKWGWALLTGTFSGQLIPGGVDENSPNVRQIGNSENLLSGSEKNENL